MILTLDQSKDRACFGDRLAILARTHTHTLALSDRIGPWVGTSQCLSVNYKHTFVITHTHI